LRDSPLHKFLKHSLSFVDVIRSIKLPHQNFSFEPLSRMFRNPKWRRRGNIGFLGR
jgi:hypothetical protein